MLRCVPLNSFGWTEVYERLATTKSRVYAVKSGTLVLLANDFPPEHLHYCFVQHYFDWMRSRLWTYYTLFIWLCLQLSKSIRKKLLTITTIVRLNIHQANFWKKINSGWFLYQVYVWNTEVEEIKESQKTFQNSWPRGVVTDWGCTELRALIVAF